jgi:hypothetical protein
MHNLNAPVARYGVWLQNKCSSCSISLVCWFVTKLFNHKYRSKFVTKLQIQYLQILRSIYVCSFNLPICLFHIMMDLELFSRHMTKVMKHGHNLLEGYLVNGMDLE